MSSLRRRRVLLAGLALAAALAAPAAVMGSGYTFADEFDGPAGAPPDPARWGYDLGGGGWGNGELQAYTSSRANSYQDGAGHLVIAATRNARGGYDSARLTTRGRFAQAGGSWQARIKLDFRPGFWPAAWLLGANIGRVGWPACGEADIMEDYGRSWVQSTVHTAGGDPDFAVRGGLASDAGWHVYQLDWSAARMDFYRDGTHYLTVTAEQFPAGAWVFGPGSGGMFLLLNLAVGGDGPGAPPPSARWPVTMLVDYVRVWP